MSAQAAEILWRPQPGPQTALLSCPVFEVFYGGARGGGKTDGMLGEFASHAAKYGKNASGLMVRRSRTELVDTIERSKALYYPLGCKWHEQDKLWRSPDGARLRFAYLENDSDAEAYQGHGYCVAVGTPLRMADGSYRAIEDINAGEMVATLEGPKRVLATVPPYLAPCVQASVRDENGEFLGSQIHPVWHPVLASAGLNGSRKHPTRHAGEQYRREKHACETRDLESRASSYPGHRGWVSWSVDGRSGCKASSSSPQDRLPLERLTVHVALHERSARLAVQRGRAAQMESTLSGALCKSFAQASGLSQRWKYSLLGLRQLLGHAQSELGHSFLYLTNAASCARYGFATGPGFLGGYRGEHDFGDGPARKLLGSDQARTPLPSGAGSRRHYLPSDESGTTQERTRSQLERWEHPYTGEARNLSEAVILGTMECVPVGMALVADLCVEGANHYIGDTGLINKNTRVYVEEIGNFPNPAPVMKLMATLRSGAGVPVGFRATGNPGGPGHQWVKARYIDPAPLGLEVMSTEFKNPFTGDTVKRERVFIPARVSDNKYLGGDYVANLQMAGSAELVRAWLEGDWNVIAGAFFPEFSMTRHVIEPQVLPADWTRYRAADWGSARPFSIGWYAISDGSIARFPRGALVKYREWYGMKDGQPNVGLKMIAEEVAKGIVELEGNDRLDAGLSVMDPAAFSEDGGPSIAERMFVATGGKIAFRKADNKRVSQKGAMGGWDQVRARLKGEDERAMIFFFSTCKHTIRTIPSLQHDQTKPEDVDTEGEDHAADETRYACMARTYIQNVPRTADVIPLRGSIQVLPSGGFATTETLDAMWDAAPKASARI